MEKLAAIFLMWLLITVDLNALTVSPEVAEKLAERIWKNESGKTIEGLTCWNAGEEFPSLGIGHFIWYPQGYKGPFQETFPSLIAFLETHGEQVPEWLKKAKGCPWKTAKEFHAQAASPRMIELRQFLYKTRALQALFIANRLEKSLPRMIEGLSAQEQKQISANFMLLAKKDNGLYALIDYLNFKGEGTSAAENYQGKGWGLKQVLLSMDSDEYAPVKAFVVAAREILKERVKHAPAARNEQRWLKGWNNRLETYLVD